MTGQSPEELIARLERRGGSGRSARELVLEAAADKLGIEVTDDEVEALVREQAELARRRRRRDAAAPPRERPLRDAPRRPAPAQRARPRRLRGQADPARLRPRRAKQIWTPEKEKQQTETKLWTPGSKEPEHMNTPVESHHPVRHRADLARRALLRHLLAAAERADHLPRHADRRPGREPRSSRR